VNIGSASSNPTTTLTTYVPLTIGYTPSSLSQLGGFVSVPYSGGSGNFTSSTTLIYGTYSLTQPGCYLFIVNCINYSSNLVNPHAECYITNATSGVTIGITAYSGITTSSTMGYSLSGFSQITTPSTITTGINVNFSSGTAIATNNLFSFNIIRIA
jgi:hypothetical protein